MRTKRYLLIPVLLGVFAVCPSSFAQPVVQLPKPVAQAMTEKARQLFAEGIKAYLGSRWADARAAFLAAWALEKHYTIAGNLADCELKLGLYRDAAEHFAVYVRALADDASTTPTERKEGEDRYAQALAKVGRIDVQVSLRGADVYVDGKPIGVAPLEYPVFLEPGSHAIEARSDGYPPARAHVDAKAGVAHPVMLTLTRTADPPRTTSTGPGLGWIIATGALAAGGLGAGIGLTVAANGKSSDADTIGARLGGRSTCSGTPGGNVSGDCEAVKSALRSKSTLSNAAFASLLGGGVFALATAGLGVWKAVAPKANDERKMVVRVVPVMGSQDAGVVVQGTW